MGGTKNFKVTDNHLDLLSYSASCETAEPQDPPCSVELFLAERKDQWVHSAYVQTGDKPAEPKVRPQKNDGADDSDFWGTAQQRMGAAYRIYLSLLGGLGTALREKNYDPETRTFLYGNEKIALQCTEDRSGIIKELALANPRHGLLFETTSTSDLLLFQGLLKCATASD